METYDADFLILSFVICISKHHHYHNHHDIGLNQIQRLNCKAKNGSFILTFRENSTVPIQYNETAYRLQLILNEVLTIREVQVTIVNPSNSVCNENGDLNVFIEFLAEHGNLPLLKYDTTNLPHSLFNISEYQESTKKDVECSGTGICNELTGMYTYNCIYVYIHIYIFMYIHIMFWDWDM
jgi:hypothetical protein